ncbi:MAG: hypothetical protein J5I93_17970 [Pirellulaceae bacterium]|nr:hypothetical protein [Pirellulaceae bacterium]
MRDNLLGYLLDALDASERAEVELALQRQPHLRRELATLKRRLEPLESGREIHEPPAGLARRACLCVDLMPVAAVEPVADSPRVLLSPADRAGGFSRLGWSMSDMVVAAGVFLAASLLFFPAIASSRSSARIAVCQNNLRQLGVQLAIYSQQRVDNRFPDVPVEGPLSFAGIFTTTLREHELLPDETLLICPSSEWAGQTHDFRIPTREELKREVGRGLRRLQEMAAGSYGYNLGYMVAGHHLAPQNRYRAAYALMSDSPQGPQRTTMNHGGCGHNILFEDGHVAYLKGCLENQCPDNPLLNDAGECAASDSSEDAVIGPSGHPPLPRIRTVSFRP